MTTRYGCHDRPPLKTSAVVQDGWTRIGFFDHKRNLISIPDPMTKTCQYTLTELGQVDVKCIGCVYKACA